MQSTVIHEHLPALRRYAIAFAGGRGRAEAALASCLRRAMGPPSAVPQDPRLHLFSLLQQCLGAAEEDLPPSDAADGGISALPPMQRAALLLVVLERLTFEQVAAVLGTTEDASRQALHQAREALRLQDLPKVLIIEDESIVGLDLSEIVTGMGYQVCGIVESRADAVAQARATRPDLLLADVRLRAGDDGIATVDEILTHIEVPVIFVTGYGHEVIMRHGVPALVVGKPFPRKTLQVAVQRALAARSEGTALAH